jgi:hypothetical protein
MWSADGQTDSQTNRLTLAKQYTPFSSKGGIKILLVLQQTVYQCHLHLKGQSQAINLEQACVADNIPTDLNTANEHTGHRQFHYP